MSETTNQIKAGVKTSEFWLALIAALIPFISTATGTPLPTEAIIGIAGPIMAYVFSRGQAKKAGK